MLCDTPVGRHIWTVGTPGIDRGRWFSLIRSEGVHSVPCIERASATQWEPRSVSSFASDRVTSLLLSLRSIRALKSPVDEIVDPRDARGAR